MRRSWWPAEGDAHPFLTHGWRIAFLVSVVLVIFGVVVRLEAAETLSFEKVQAGEQR